MLINDCSFIVAAKYAFVIARVISWPPLYSLSFYCSSSRRLAYNVLGYAQFSREVK